MKYWSLLPYYNICEFNQQKMWKFLIKTLKNALDLDVPSLNEPYVDSIQMNLESLLKKSSNCCSPGCYRWCIGCYQYVIVHLHVHVINSFLFFSFLASLWPRQNSGFNCILLSTCDRFALINITQWHDARNQTGSSRRSIPLPSFFAVQFTTFRIKAFTWSTWYHIHNHIISIGMDHTSMALAN